MKDNTKEVKLLIEKLISIMPNDYALNVVKFHLKSAFHEVEMLEKKRNKREVGVQGRKDNKKLTPALNSIDAIESEIIKTKNKIEEMKNKKKFQSDDDNDNDINIFG